MNEDKLEFNYDLAYDAVGNFYGIHKILFIGQKVFFNCLFTDHFKIADIFNIIINLTMQSPATKCTINGNVDNSADKKVY